MSVRLKGQVLMLLIQYVEAKEDFQIKIKFTAGLSRLGRNQTTAIQCRIPPCTAVELFLF